MYFRRENTSLFKGDAKLCILELIFLINVVTKIMYRIVYDMNLILDLLYSVIEFQIRLTWIPLTIYGNIAFFANTT